MGAAGSGSDPVGMVRRLFRHNRCARAAPERMIALISRATSPQLLTGLPPDDQAVRKRWTGSTVPPSGENRFLSRPKPLRHALGGAHARADEIGHALRRQLSQR